MSTTDWDLPGEDRPVDPFSGEPTGPPDSLSGPTAAKSGGTDRKKCSSYVSRVYADVLLIVADLR